jgi:branched-subunit amino acid transport protein AzlD
MRLRRWQVEIAATLIVAAIGVYALRWWLFPSESFHEEMVRYLVDDIAFLFIQVLLVSMLIDGLMQRRQRETTLDKLNMIVGAFFSECGTDVLGRIAKLDADLEQIRGDLLVRVTWKARDFERAKQAFRAHKPVIELSACDLAALRERLDREKSYLLSLLGNQALLEHEAFTDLLWAVTHLTEELHARGDFDQLPAPDCAHLAADVRRAYTLLGVQWIDYLRHLQVQYPFLFSLSVRTNPLDPEARVTVLE